MIGASRWGTAMALGCTLAGAVVASELEGVVAYQAADTSLQREIEAESAEDAARLARPLTLDDCIQLALRRNLGLAVARRARDAARTQIGAAYGDFLPELTLTAARSSTEILESAESAVSEATESNGGAVVTTRLPLGTTIEAGYTYAKTGDDRLPAEGPSLSITQPLLRDAGWRTATSGVRDAQLAADVQEVALRAAVLGVIFEVKAAYYDIQRRRSLIRVNEQAVTRDETLVEFSRAKVDAQLATTRDVLSAEIVLAQDRARLINAQAQYVAALDRLSNVLGLRIARDLVIPDDTLGLRPLAVNESAWVARALHDNPQVQSALLELERDELARDVAGNGRLPRLDLSLAYDELRGNVLERDVSLAQKRTRGWQGAVTLSYPLLNRAPGNAHRRAKLEYEQRRRQALDTQRLVTLDVRDAVRNLQRIEERIAILERNIEGARAKVEFANVNFQLGRASNLDITDAQKDLLDAETDRVNELVNYRVEVARLEQLLGGSL